MSARRTWGIAALLLALILIIATFPMRLALDLSGATDAGITAREVRGSVWSGELVDARLGALPLGTVRASLSPLALLDARHFWLPDRLNLLLGILGLLVAGPLMGTLLIDRWVGAVVCGLTLAAIAQFYRRARLKDAMGGGDPKLVAAIGAWLGWQALPLMLLLASLGGIVWALIAGRKGDQPLGERRIPFGVFACTAAFATVPLWPLLVPFSFQ